MVVWLLAFSLGATLQAQSPDPAPVEARIPIAPTPAKGDRKTLLVYEIHLTNFLPREITLTRLEVLDQESNPVASFEGNTLAELIAQYSAPAPPADKRKIGGGMRAVIYMWLSFDPTQPVPRALSHKFSFDLVGADGKIGPRSLEISSLVVARAAPVFISPPFRGGTWVAVNGPSNSSVHRRAFQVVNGSVFVSQRFAIDWGKLGEDGKFWHGDPGENANWYGYGTEILAVADGVVASIRDGIPQNIPLSPTRAVPITQQTLGGNYIIVALKGGEFAYYAHLQPDSLRVKPGERVHKGQVLALLGNSGNSDAPHLHFHVSNENSAQGSEGLPYAFHSFEVMGRLAGGLTDGWSAAGGTKPQLHLGEIPMENAVVRLP